MKPSERIKQICEEIRKKEWDEISCSVNPNNHFLMTPYWVYSASHPLENYLSLAICSYLDEIKDILLTPHNSIEI